MRFWDPSGIVPLLVDQPRSTRVKQLFREDPAVVVWWLTTVECWSAFARLRREQVFDLDDEASARAHLEELRQGWAEVVPSEELRAIGGRLVRVHAIRAADAMQLAAAQLWAGSPVDAEFVTLDDRLGRVAALEGFRVRG
jgi:predicted nucleic acid-binding protein